MTPLPATRALDAFFLDARSRLLDVAAFLDRVGRGSDAAALQADPRMLKILHALEVIRTQPAGRAEAVQKLFSLDYDPSWPRPEPR